MRRRVHKGRVAGKGSTGADDGRPMSIAQALGLVGLTLFFGITLLIIFTGDQEKQILLQQPHAVEVSHESRSVPGNGTDPGSFLLTEHAISSKKVSAASALSARKEFGVCGRTRHNCVVDGDTFWLSGQKIRISDIDTPEIHQPGCAGEGILGEKAKQRLVMLLNDGPFELKQAPGRVVDHYGRRLLIVTRNGTSLGEQLVAEGLAHRWKGRKESWCE